MNNGEERGVDADAERQRQNCHTREACISAETAEREADVSRERFEKRQAALLAIRLFRLFDAAEFTMSSSACVIHGHAALDVRFNQRVHVSAEFVIQLALGA